MQIDALFMLIHPKQKVHKQHATLGNDLSDSGHTSFAIFRILSPPIYYARVNSNFMDTYGMM